MSKEKEKIIIDTDPGVDDSMAIIMLENSKEFEILAVTTVAGNGPIERCTNNARFILDLVNSKTPLYSGAQKPLARDLITANVHGTGGLGGLEVTTQTPLDGQAVAKIVDLVMQNPDQVTILAIGPLTNLAKALQQEPDLAKNIKRIVMMGGAIEAPGNKNRVAEFNVFVDPEAAEIVYNAEVEKVIIPLDVCITVPLYLSDFETLKGSPLYEPINSMMRTYIEKILEFENIKGGLMYDPLAAYYLLNPKAFKGSQMDVRVETKGELTRGMTVADRRTWGEKKINMSVMTSVDRDSFVNDFLKLLSKK